MSISSINLKSVFRKILCPGLIVVIPGMLVSCGSHQGHDHASDSSGGGKGEVSGQAMEAHKEAKGAGGIHMEPEDAERYGVATRIVEPGEFRESVKVAAEIMPASSDIATASAPAAGMVRLAQGVTRGMTVKAGQVIARLDMSGMSGGDQNKSGKVAIENAKRELDRLSPLLEDGLITKKEYNDALAAYELAKASYSPRAASGAVTAPRSGVISNIVSAEGAFVNTGDPVAVISASGNLTLRALLPVRHASFLPSVSGVVITPHGEVEAIDLSSYGGRIISSNSASAAETPGYIPVYYVFDNSAPVVAGSAAEAYLRGTTRQGVISVPVSSVSEQLGEKFVYVRKGDHEYEKRHIKTGASDGMEIEVTGGLSSGEEVVVDGTSFIRLAEQSTVVPEGHSHNH